MVSTYTLNYLYLNLILFFIFIINLRYINIIYNISYTIINIKNIAYQTNIHINNNIYYMKILFIIMFIISYCLNDISLFYITYKYFVYFCLLIILNYFYIISFNIFQFKLYFMSSYYF